MLEDAGVAIVTVERSQGDAGEVSVEYATSDGSATDGADYTGVSGTLTWFAGDDTDRTFVVPILDDTDPEGDETIELTLHTPTGGAVIDDLRGTAVITILANDGTGGGGGGGGGGGDAGTIKLGDDTFQVAEGGGVATITVERSQGDSGAASIDYTTLEGSATDGVDYTGVSGTLSWDGGDSTDKTVLIPILDDADAEGNETLEIVLSNPVGAQLDPARDSAVVTIVDDDSALCAAGDDTLCLLGGRFQVQVTWQTATATAGTGRPVALSDQSGLMWFFDPANVELLVKVLDGCSFTDSYWVFLSATTDLGVEVTVTDTVTGTSKTYVNPLGKTAKAVQDVVTFACD